MRKLWILLVFIVFLVSCTKGGEEMGWPQVRFALEQIKEAVEETGFDSGSFEFLLDSLSLEEQAYRIESVDRNVKIYGGDATGLMYGGLEVAEQIRLHGRVEDCQGNPFIARRGIKFNIPLDARTPSYDDSGDAAQENISTMWDWSFWEHFLDQMAQHRYNMISFWNPHPFPSMIKLADYPEVALDDVCRTTLEPVGLENEWGDPGLVTSNVMDNLEVVLEMSIEEKITFWQKVMQHAQDRGIDVYWINWNICPNSVAPAVEPFYKTYEINLGVFEEGKHGVTYEISNPVTIDYYRKAVSEFLRTYPTVKGIGATAGEHMPLSWEGYNREKWLWETYGMGIKQTLEEDPEREVDFIHRVWHSDMDQIMNYWKDYPGNFQVSFKYAKARLYSSPRLPFADSHVEEMKPYGLKSWWNLRNDDIFVYRWGDPDYVRAFLEHFPGEYTAGYHMGSDGYVWGREFISKDPEFSGQPEIDKHWYRFMLWGRLGYNIQLASEFFIGSLEQHYEVEKGKELYDVWQQASGIIPLVNRFHWRDWDHHWSVEGCMARPVLGGYRDVFDFVDNPTLEGSGLLNPRDYARLLQQGRDVKEGNPLSVVKSLHLLADEALAGVKNISCKSKQRALELVLEDIRAQAWLGKYYAEKIRSAVYLALYQEMGKQEDRTLALAALEEAHGFWKKYTELSEQHYRPQMLARTNRLDWSALGDSVNVEIEKLKNLE